MTKNGQPALIIIIFAVLSEAFNSVMEAVCNCERDSLNLDYTATKIARDLSAGAVLLLSAGSVILGLVIFLPHLLP